MPPTIETIRDCDNIVFVRLSPENLPGKFLGPRIRRAIESKFEWNQGDILDTLAYKKGQSLVMKHPAQRAKAENESRVTRAMEIEELNGLESLPLLSLNHVSLLCRSVWNSVRFYEDVLGFCLIKRPTSFDFTGAWLASSYSFLLTAYFHKISIPTWVFNSSVCMKVVQLWHWDTPAGEPGNGGVRPNQWSSTH